MPVVLGLVALAWVSCECLISVVEGQERDVGQAVKTALGPCPFKPVYPNPARGYGYLQRVGRGVLKKYAEMLKKIRRLL